MGYKLEGFCPGAWGTLSSLFQDYVNRERFAAYVGEYLCYDPPRGIRAHYLGSREEVKSALMRALAELFDVC